MVLSNNPHCRRCSLYEKSQTVCCPSYGPKNASMFFVGEALGAYEDEQGKPFVGDAGKKLSWQCSEAGIHRKHVLIGNACRCRPPGNRQPSPKQLEACLPYLLFDILKNKPKVIVALGATAMRVLLPGRKLDEWRGFEELVTFSYESPKTGKTASHTCWVVPTYHPAACLRSWELDKTVIQDLQVAKHLEQFQTAYHTMPLTKVVVIKTLAQARWLMQAIQRKQAVATDLETTGLNPHTSQIMCAGFNFGENTSYILPFMTQGKKAFWKSKERVEILKLLGEALRKTPLIGQNIKFDIQHYRKLLGIDYFNISFDTMLAHHILDENRPHNLTYLCQTFLQWHKYDAKMDAYKTKVGRHRYTFRTWEAPDQELWTYCAHDVNGTFKLYRLFKEKIEEEKLVNAFAHNRGLINPVADMEFVGVHGDRKKLQVLAEKNKAIICKHKSSLQKVAAKYIDLTNKKGESIEFNPASTVQLKKLFEALNAPLRRKTKGGNVSTDKMVIAAFALKNTTYGAVARKIQQLRRASKIVSTYLDGGDKKEGGFLDWLSPQDRWHSNYNIGIARTGRLSADDPPIQTMPREDNIRSMIIPDDPEDVFVSADYSKLELCVGAWLANEEVMIDELVAGIDLHTKMGVTVRLGGRNPTEEEFARIAPMITKDERAIAKGVNFGVIYGRGAANIADSNPDAFPAKMPRTMRIAKVQDMIDAYFQKYQSMAIYREEQIAKMLQHGYLRSSLFGVKRRFDGVSWFESRWADECDHTQLDLAHLMNEALNFEIQNIATYHLHIATKQAYLGIRKLKMPRLRIVLSLHDALLFNCRKQDAEEVVEHVKEWMETILPRDKRHKFEMPLRVDAMTQAYWGQEYE